MTFSSPLSHKKGTLSFEKEKSRLRGVKLLGKKLHRFFKTCKFVQGAPEQTHHIETEEGIVSQSPRGCYPIPDDKPDINGWSPMMCAALSGDSRAAVKLIRKGEYLKEEVISCEENPQLDGTTPLHLAVGSSPELFKPGSRAYNEALQVLLANGANPFVENRSGVTAFDLALHKHNSRNLRTLAQFATFAGVFSIKVQGLFRKVIYQRILYVIPRFPYRLMKEGKPEPESTEDVSKQMTAVIVGFEMYNFDKPAFVIPLQNANFRQIQETPEAFEEGPTEGLLHFFDSRQRIPGLITRLGGGENEHILHMTACEDDPQSAAEVLKDFQSALEETYVALENQDPVQMYKLMVGCAKTAKGPGKSLAGQIADEILELNSKEIKHEDSFKQVSVDPEAKLTVMRTPAKIRKAAEDLDTETLTKKTEAQGLGLQKSSSALARLWSYITKKKEGSSTTQTINGNSESVKKFSLESGQKVSADTSEEDKEDQLLHSTKPEGQSSNKLKKKVSFNTHEILDNDIADKSDNITSDSKALQGAPSILRTTPIQETATHDMRQVSVRDNLLAAKNIGSSSLDEVKGLHDASDRPLHEAQSFETWSTLSTEQQLEMVKSAKINMRMRLRTAETLVKSQEEAMKSGSMHTTQRHNVQQFWKDTIELMEQILGNGMLDQVSLQTSNTISLEKELRSLSAAENAELESQSQHDNPFSKDDDIFSPFRDRAVLENQQILSRREVSSIESGQQSQILPGSSAEPNGKDVFSHSTHTKLSHRIESSSNTDARSNPRTAPAKIVYKGERVIIWPNSVAMRHAQRESHVKPEVPSRSDMFSLCARVRRIYQRLFGLGRSKSRQQKSRQAFSRK